jgi:hypothetical protein
MKTFIHLTLVILVLLTASMCRKRNIADNTPRHIKTRIIDFSKNSHCPDSHVDEYLFQSEKVYVFEGGTCGADMISMVYNEEGDEIGSLGGITGNTKIKGTDFSEAGFLRVIWKKDQ